MELMDVVKILRVLSDNVFHSVLFFVFFFFPGNVWAFHVLHFRVSIF